jgi:hypothetical protein
MDYFTNKKFVTWTIIILVALNVFTLSSIWLTKLFRPGPFPHTFHEERRPPVEKFIERELDLSKDQVIKFEQSRKRHKIQSKALHDAIFFKKEKLINELFTPDVDSTEIKKLSEEIGMIQIEFEMQNNLHILELRSICNTEQQKKLKFLFNEMLEKSRPEEHRPPPHQPPPPPRDEK